MRLFWAVCVPVILTACAADVAPGVDDLREELAVRELIELYYRDFNNSEWNAVSGHFWSNADITTVWQEAGENGDRVVHTIIDDFFTQAPR